MAVGNPIFGPAGDFSGPSGNNGLFRNWNFRSNQRVETVEGFQQTWQRTGGGGPKGGTWDASGHPTRDASNTAPGVVAGGMSATGNSVTLSISTAATACTITGTGIVESASLGASFDAPPTLSYSGRFDGEITENWDETA